VVAFEDRSREVRARADHQLGHEHARRELIEHRSEPLDSARQLYLVCPAEVLASVSRPDEMDCTVEFAAASPKNRLSGFSTNVPLRNLSA
jgi:hypothetical protein